MKFIDTINIQITAGTGGDGCIHFRREKFIPKGGPNGGDGGDGGNIWIITNKNLNTLINLKFKKHIKAENGKSGKPNNQSGKKGADKIIFVPIGTRIINNINKEIIVDLDYPNSKILIAKGGKKGIGNNKFKSSINRTPYQRTMGKKGENYFLTLQLILISDVGVLGLPNSGKSTLVNSLSNSKTKIGSYPFTTLKPTLGTVKINNSSFVISDIPGLIKGASKGHGLGIKFLKHLEKCRILLHLIDIIHNIQEIINNINIIEIELKKYNENLYNKTRWFIFNKIDKLNNKKIYQIKKNIKKHIQNHKIIYFISAKKNIGTKKLSQQLMHHLTNIKNNNI